MYKFTFNSINPSAALTVLGSLGAHGLLAVSLPILPIYSQGEPGPLEVPIVELSPEEMARIPALQPPPPVAYIPPSATQLLPLPPNFQLPAATSRPTPAPLATPTTPAVPAIPVAPRVASSPALPSRPNGGMTSYPYPTITRPNNIVMRGGGGLLPRPASRIGSQGNIGRSVGSSDSLRNARNLEVRGNTFKPNLNAKPEDTLNNSLGDSLNPKPESALPSAPARPVSPINPGQIRPVAPVNGTQGTAVVPFSPPVLLPTPQQGAPAPSQPAEALKPADNRPQEARNSTVPLPTNSGAQQLGGPMKPQGSPTLAPSENRAPQLPRDIERQEVRRDKPENESNQSPNRPTNRREEESPKPSHREEDAKTPRNREEEETQSPRHREETVVPRQESRVPDNPASQNAESPTTAPSGIKKEKPAPQEENGAERESPSP